MNATTMSWTLTRRATVAVAVGLGGIALFQLAIAAGAPVGRAAWGGAGWGPLLMPQAVARWVTWVLFGLLLVVSLMNFASSSAWERYLWGPYALILAVLCLLTARGA